MFFQNSPKDILPKYSAKYFTEYPSRYFARVSRQIFCQNIPQYILETNATISHKISCQNWHHPLSVHIKIFRGRWFHPDHQGAMALAWQAWHLATSTFVSRGRRGTSGTGLASTLVSRGVAGVAGMANVAGVAGVAGVALGDIRSLVTRLVATSRL